MDKFIKLLDKNLEYISHEAIDNTFYIIKARNRTTLSNFNF
ncbi:hypothetical protein CLOACE_19790 [Clostridium acetireducens DSM 10703]|uniref:Uncharacterized protein n=1 Tax=Clostridium acetireducens DSM 10703 TaxID=1121290 RepID=A0A1E8EWN4_9CLOT|nr:hypothetical protein CLOACE_19790 [Clostridium acetireducens DSM 10703]